VKRETQTVLMLLLGIGVTVMVVKGAYLHYVKPSLLPWLVIAAALLVALAVVSIVGDIRRRGVQPGSGHAHRGTMVWLLLVPIILIAFVIPPPIESSGATPVSAAQPQRRAFPPLPSERAPVVSLPEVVMRAATDSAGTLDNRLISVTGFTMAGPDLARVVIVCCAADAQLARLHLTGPGAEIAAGYPEDTWLRIEGRVVAGTSSAATSFIPTVFVTEATKVERPANTYAY
jgi:uncharacterized repeat protein (TIGR03943 family)